MHPDELAGRRRRSPRGRPRVRRPHDSVRGRSRRASGRAARPRLGSERLRRTEAEAPGGYASRDGATFSSVVAGTALTYNVVLRNDFAAQTASDQVFPAAVLITAGGYPVQRVPLWVLVPPR